MRIESGARCSADFAPPYDRLGSNPVLRRCRLNVRITPGSGRAVDIPERQVRARSCHRALSAHSRNLLALVARRDREVRRHRQAGEHQGGELTGRTASRPPRDRRRRTMTTAILGSALFFVVAPSVLAGLIPWWMTHWEFLPPF